MPEGPEIRQVADKLSKVLLGQTVQVEFSHPHLQPFGEELSGQTVTEVTSVGKALLIRFHLGLSIYCHSQLYGRWYVVSNEKLPRTNRQLRLSLKSPKGWGLLYSATDIEVLSKDDFAAHHFLAKLGPDLLDPKTTPAKLLKHLLQKKFVGRNLPALLLDQGAFCGVGNYLRSEILFESKIGPNTCLKKLTGEQQKRLAKCAISMTRRAYEQKGVTNLAKRANQLKNQGVPRRLYRHLVFSRLGQPCFECETMIEKEDFAGRRLYFCPTCQDELASLF